jgi:hypothetical protein
MVEQGQEECYLLRKNNELGHLKLDKKWAQPKSSGTTEIKGERSRRCFFRRLRERCVEIAGNDWTASTESKV